MAKYERPVCRGCWALGTACGRCERCAETKPPSPSFPPSPSVGAGRDEAERDAIIEACAVAASGIDRIGYEWIRDSLWDVILRRAGDNVRALKGKLLP